MRMRLASRVNPMVTVNTLRSVSIGNCLIKSSLGGRKPGILEAEEEEEGEEEEDEEEEEDDRGGAQAWRR